MKPVILVTRKLPEAVEDRLRRDYQPILNPTDTLYSSADIINMAAEADATPYVRQLAWREFYADVLFHRPASAREYWRPELAGMAYDPFARRARLSRDVRVNYLAWYRPERTTA